MIKLKLDESLRNTFVIHADCEFGDGGDDGRMPLDFRCATLEETEEIYWLNELLRHSNYSKGDKKIKDYVENCQNKKVIEAFLEEYPSKYEAGSCYFSNDGLEIHYYGEKCQRYNVIVEK